MTAQDTARGQLAWYDLFTPDPAASAAFICELTGWQTHTMDMGGHAYTMFMDGETGIGGLEKLNTPGPGYWLGYVNVASLEDTLAAVAAKGGATIQPPTPIGPTSAYASFRDAEGALCGIVSDSEDAGRGTQPGVGRFTWSELASNDHEAARDFYLSLFHWDASEAMPMGMMGTYQTLKQGGGDWHIGGMYNKPPMVPAPYWAHYISVPDLDAALELVKARGGSVLFPPMSVGGDDRIVQCIDPQGCNLALHATG